MAKKPQVPEKTWFEEDPSLLDTPTDKNDRLGNLLNDKWSTCNIVSIRRIEIGVRGWEILYRDA